MCTSIQLLVALLAVAFTSHGQIMPREDSCDSGYAKCAPSSAHSISTPQIGNPALQSLYTDLISSSLPSSDPNKSPPATPQSISADSPSLCCSKYQQCMTLSGVLIPFCYSRFTTNFFLPDGSYGTVASGSYKSASGATANLLSGDYKFENGTTGNIYAGNEAARPDTKTLVIPSQFTGKGVGTVVPASELGAVVTVVTKTMERVGGGVTTETVTTTSARSGPGPATSTTASGGTDSSSMVATAGQSSQNSLVATTTMEYSVTFSFASVNTAGTTQTSSARSLTQVRKGWMAAFAIMLPLMAMLLASL